MSARVVWALRGCVVHGFGRGGSLLGFPTANIALDPPTTRLLLPLDNGVYFGWGCVEGKDAKEPCLGPYGMVMSLGHNPHFHDKELTVEVHMLHKFDTDFYGSIVRIVVCGYLRQMAAFTTLDALIDMIRHDIDIAKKQLFEKPHARWKECRFLLDQGAEFTAKGVPQLVLPFQEEPAAAAASCPPTVDPINKEPPRPLCNNKEKVGQGVSLL